MTSTFNVNVDLKLSIKGGVSVSWRMIILLCGRDQCGLNAHSVDPDSMRIESWSSVDRPYIDPFV